MSEMTNIVNGIVYAEVEVEVAEDEVDVSKGILRMIKNISVFTTGVVVIKEEE